MNIQWQGVAAPGGTPMVMRAEFNGFSLEAWDDGLYMIRHGTEAIAGGCTRNLDEALAEATREFATIHTSKEPKR